MTGELLPELSDADRRKDREATDRQRAEAEVHLTIADHLTGEQVELFILRGKTGVCGSFAFVDWLSEQISQFKGLGLELPARSVPYRGSIYLRTGGNEFDPVAPAPWFGIDGNATSAPMFGEAELLSLRDAALRDHEDLYGNSIESGPDDNP